MSQIKPVRETHFKKAISLFRTLALYKATSHIIAIIDVEEKYAHKTKTKFTEEVIHELHKIYEKVPKEFKDGSVAMPQTYNECLDYVRFPNAWAEKHKNQ